MVHSIHKFKMAEGSWNHENFARGWVRALLDAIKFFERRRMEIEVLGRAGIAPPNQTRTPSRNESEYSRQDEGHFPCRGAGALSIVEYQLGDLSARRGRGRCLSSHPHYATHTCKEGKR